MKLNILTFFLFENQLAEKYVTIDFYKKFEEKKLKIMNICFNETLERIS